MSRPKVLDLFSGIGGFSLGLERAGFETAAFCEIDPWCRRVLAKHWPEVPRYDDVQHLTAARLRADGIEGIDTICGGFPCQDVSLAGPGHGLDGERSGLWRQVRRLAGELRPRRVLVENVGALRGRGLAAILGDLAALGFDADAHAVPAAAAGAHHLRDRVWIVAWRVDMRPCEFCGYVFDHDRLGRYRCPNCCGEGALADAPSPRLQERFGLFGSLSRALSAASAPGQWSTEPMFLRNVHGVPNRLDRRRVKALGNAVYPPLVEIIGRSILEQERAA